MIDGTWIRRRGDVWRFAWDADVSVTNHDKNTLRAVIRSTESNRGGILLEGDCTATNFSARHLEVVFSGTDRLPVGTVWVEIKCNVADVYTTICHHEITVEQELV